MIQTNFIYEGHIITLQCNKNEVMEEILKKYEVKGNAENKSIFYLYNVNKINKELIGNNNNINIIVNSINEIENNNLINNK